MNDDNKRPNYYNSIRWNQSYTMNVNGAGTVTVTGAKGWRKRQVVDKMMDELHETQLQMIDEAVEASDLRQAKEVIDYIRNKA